MNSLNFIRYYGVLLLATLVYSTWGMLLLLFRHSKESVLNRAGQSWGKVCLKNAGIQLDIQGKENLQKTPAIFVINHQSTLDIFAICAILPFKTLPVAKKSLSHIPFFGWFTRAAGIVFIDRKDTKNARAGINQAGDFMQEGYSIILAPEGTRSGKRELAPFKKGAFHLAIQTKLPMIPIVIKDAFKLQAHSQWVPTPGIIKIKIENPISTQIWTLQTLKLHVEEVRKIMSQSLLQ